jgi:SAM-dependent methyltransferase
MSKVGGMVETIRRKNLHEIGAAVVRRLLPRSPRYGFPWVTLPDGSVTFHEHGFVAASSPSLLLARHNYETETIDRALKDLQVPRSLEIGCGFGRLSMAIGRHATTCVAVDINEDALTSARIAYPHIDYRVARADDLPFDDASFGLVCTWTVLQHIPPSRFPLAAREILRVLDGTGTLLMCEETRLPNASSTHTWHRTVTDYEEAFAPLRLRSHDSIPSIDRIPGMVSPGEVMVFG